MGLSASNLKSAFKKCGVFPFDPQAYPSEKINSHTLFTNPEPEESIQDSHVLPTDSVLPTEPTSSAPQTKDLPINTPDTLVSISKFLDSKTINAEKVRAKFVPPKPRNTLSKVVAGKAITEAPVVEQIEKHLSNMQSKPCPSKSVKGKSKRKFTPPLKQNVPQDSETETEDSTSDEKCCVCNSFYPPKKARLDHIFIVNWGQCSNCQHWTHLSFCTNVKVLRRHSVFLCPHCENSISEQ